MTNKPPSFQSIRSYLGDVSKDMSNHDVIVFWLNETVDNLRDGSGVFAFAPFASYFSNPQPFDYQLAALVKNEFSSGKNENGPSEKALFEAALSTILENPNNFMEQDGGNARFREIRAIFINFFELLLEINLPRAVNVATSISRNKNLSEMPIKGGKTVISELFRALDEIPHNHATAKEFYEAVYKYMTDSPERMVAKIPSVIEARILSLGGNYDLIFRTLCATRRLEDVYRNHLSLTFPTRLSKNVTRLSNRILMALPNDFPDFLAKIPKKEFSKVKNLALIYELDFERESGDQPPEFDSAPEFFPVPAPVGEESIDDIGNSLLHGDKAA